MPASTLVFDRNGNPIKDASEKYLLGIYNNPVGPGRSIYVSCVDGFDDNYDGMDFYGSPNLESNDFLDAAGALALPVERRQYFVEPYDLTGTGVDVGFNTLINAATDFFRVGLGPDGAGRVGYLHYMRRRASSHPSRTSVTNGRLSAT